MVGTYPKGKWVRHGHSHPLTYHLDQELEACLGSKGWSAGDWLWEESGVGWHKRQGLVGAVVFLGTATVQ